MRPAEKEVQFSLHTLECLKASEASGDEPYLWVAAFKVDGTTIVAGLPPRVYVEVFSGTRYYRNVVGTETIKASARVAIPPDVGQRTFRVKPWRTNLNTWFPGLVGVAALLFDEDNFEPDGIGNAYNAFREELPNALADSINAILRGDHDVALSDKGEGLPRGVIPLQWRMDQLSNREARERVIAVVRGTVSERVRAKVRSAFLNIQPLWALLDPDDSLGEGFQVNLLNELSHMPLEFVLRLQGDGGDYRLFSSVRARSVHGGRLHSTVTSVEEVLDASEQVRVSACPGISPPTEYSAYAFRQKITTRYEFQTLPGDPVQEFRWLINGTPLNGAEGTVTVEYGSMAQFSVEGHLAERYPGGTGLLRYRISGNVLDIWNEPANGFFTAKVTALYSYPGDPELDVRDLESGYAQSADLTIAAIELVMDEAYGRARKHCEEILSMVDEEPELIPNRIDPVVRVGYPLDPIVRVGYPPPTLAAVKRALRLRSPAVKKGGWRVLGVSR